MSIRNMDGPIVEKNMADFEELKELQNEFARQLQVYNQSVKQLIDESRDYISSSSRANNQFANTYLKDPAGGVGYVTERGVWKLIPTPKIGDSMQGKNGCPLDWSNAPIISPDKEPSFSLSNAKEGAFVEIGGEHIIKGTSSTTNQSCI